MTDFFVYNLPSSVRLNERFERAFAEEYQKDGFSADIDVTPEVEGLEHIVICSSTPNRMLSRAEVISIEAIATSLQKAAKICDIPLPVCEVVTHIQ